MHGRSVQEGGEGGRIQLVAVVPGVPALLLLCLLCLPGVVVPLALHRAAHVHVEGKSRGVVGSC